MARYELYFTSMAEKDLHKFDSKLGLRILEKIKELPSNPKPPGSKKLKNTDYYRIRVGDYRIIYGIETGPPAITVFKIRHRRDAYK